MPAPQRRDAQQGGGNSAKVDGKTNGNRSGFRTDTAISNGRFGAQRTLQPWVSDSNDTFDGSLEKSSSSAGWDQFAENERLFGLKTDYDESIYTTAINRDHPQYRERIAAAEKKAREIERSAAITAHVAEERVMDYSGGKDRTDDNEEDKYSGVRRQDFPPLASGRENRYMPPAKRAPTGQATVKGAPVDPAIISAQIKAVPKKQPSQASEQPKAGSSDVVKNGTSAKAETQKAVEAQSSNSKPTESKNPTPAPTPASAAASAPVKDVKAQEEKPVEKQATTTRATPTNARPLTHLPPNAPSATSTVERDVLNSFKSFATQQRLVAEKARSNKAKADKEVKLTELKKFANSFKLSTPVPTDLVSIIAKDPVKQREIQAKAMKNAEEMAKAKSDAAQAKKEVITPKDASQPKPAEQASTAPPAVEARPVRGAPVPQATPPAGGSGRHTGPRQQFTQQQYHAQGYRNGRVGPQHVPQPHANGTLAQRIRNVEQQKFSQPPAPHQHAVGPEIRAPPTGPSNNVDYSRRHSGHLGAKLNPNSNEFRPSPFAPSFSPNGHPSAGSSPRSAVNHVSDPATAANQPQGQLIRRKTKAVDVNKCYILSHIKTIAPPQGRNWDDNGGLRPSYDTLPTWRQLQDDEKADSTMHLTYKEYFERQPFSAPSMPTPNPSHVVPQLAHQHQLPFHLQHGAQHMMPRQSPHMPPMQMHTPQHGPMPHQPYGNDDHRMMHSNSAQSFASPRMGQLPVAYPQVNPGAQVPYGQPVFLGAGNPQMGQFRSFSNNPHYVPPQGQMGAPMMIQPGFIPGPQGMMAAPHLMYPGAHHPQFMPPNGPPQPVPGANGYPSPGRPAAPMMVHQGSQQGHNMYGMSPNIQYTQPAYGPAQTSTPMSNVRSYNGPGPQHFAPQQQAPHHYSPQPPNNSGNYNNGNKHHLPPSHPHPGQQANRTASTSPQSQEADGSDEAK
ncbi:hypothetical protein TARUN_6559 [Trichoderma arundinaceum]|uniref:LsmAD domain-containing protein n=1 Tax=Trichoderma arundinaceum TaxID=490622 RepID=A0A395NHU7_TRIAR|nr:hypothetical protein TARUN_6559 [Trichoderma arundinaceum]